MAARTEPQPQPEPAGRAAQGTRKSHPTATMLPARTVLLLSLLLTFSLHHATGKEPQGLLLLQVRALSPHWGGQAGTPEGIRDGAADGSSTPCSGQGSTSWDAGMDGEGAGCSQQSQTWGGAAGAWRRLWQLFPATFCWISKGLDGGRTCSCLKPSKTPCKLCSCLGKPQNLIPRLGTPALLCALGAAAIWAVRGQVPGCLLPHLCPCPSPGLG